MELRRTTLILNCIYNRKKNNLSWESVRTKYQLLQQMRRGFSLLSAKFSKSGIEALWQEFPYNFEKKIRKLIYFFIIKAKRNYETHSHLFKNVLSEREIKQVPPKCLKIQVLDRIKKLASASFNTHSPFQSECVRRASYYHSENPDFFDFERCKIYSWLLLPMKLE